jgi:hypothetical protein
VVSSRYEEEDEEEEEEEEGRGICTANREIG